MTETITSADPSQAPRRRKTGVMTPGNPPRRRKRKTAKPDKPYPDFPLFAHATKRWAKKIRGRLYYFGPWTDPDGALAKYLAQKEDLYAGRRPVDSDAIFTVETLVNRFLAFKKARVDSGELTPRSFAEYYATCQRVLGALKWHRAVNDLRAEDFEAYRADCAKKWGPHRLSGEVQRVRSLFKYAFDAGLIDRPVRFGPGFVKPSKTRMRMHRAAGDKKLFSRQEILAMVNGALIVGKDGPELVQPSTQLKAMALLGVNCGFGNHDCGMLPLSALDLESGCVDFARPKTGIQRRCPLWPETAAALREVLVTKPKVKDPEAEGRVFVTKYGGCWAKRTELTTTEDGKPAVNTDNPVSKEIRKLLDRLGINGRRNFYCLRHVFETIGGESRDQVAVDHIMGHVDPSMGVHYRERIGEDRLRAVTEYVRRWLFGEATAK